MNLEDGGGGMIKMHNIYPCFPLYRAIKNKIKQDMIEHVIDT